MKKLNWKPLALMLSPYALYFLGGLLNLIVLTVNHGAFPVVNQVQFDGATAGQMLDQVHRVMQHGDHLKFLSDWINLWNTGIASPGDVLLWLGLALEPYGMGAGLMAMYTELTK